MKNTLYSLSFMFVLLGVHTHAQQTHTFSQYMVNPYLINPAAAGSMDGLPISMAFRQQWAGFTDAPVSQLLNSHGKIASNMALGGMVYNEKTGPLSRLNVQASYAYHLKLSDNDRLSLGMSAMMQHFAMDQSILHLHDEQDQVITGARQTAIVPDFSAGAYYFGKAAYFGVALPQMFNMRVKIGEIIIGENRLRPHAYIHGGYKISLGEDWIIEPSFLAKMMSKAPLSWDLNIRAEYGKFVWAGLSYRHNDAVVGLLGMQVEQFRIGYAYDFTTSNIRTYSGGSHELYLQFTIPSKKGGSKAGGSSAEAQPSNRERM